MPQWKFEVGQQVVCITPTSSWGAWQMDADGSIQPRPPGTVPAEGGIYTVTDILPPPDVGPYAGSDMLFLLLAEMDSETAWIARAFEPVKKTDIGVFNELLAPSPAGHKRALEDA